MSQLRKALADGGDGAAIVTRGHGYELRLGARRARRRALRAAAWREGAPREALALWRGPPLDDVAGEPFAAAEIRRLEELRLAALEQAIDARPRRRPPPRGRRRARRARRRGAAARAPARPADARALPLRAARPTRSRPTARRAARWSRRSAIEPGPELRRLHEAILRQDPALEPPAAEAAELPPELDAAHAAGRAARPSWTGCASSGGRAHAGAGRRRADRWAARDRQDAAGGGAGRRGAPRARRGAATPPARARRRRRSRRWRRCGSQRRPTLLVLDDVDRAGAEVEAALGELAGGLAALPVLVRGDAADADVTALRADATLRSTPLGRRRRARAVAALRARAPARRRPSSGCSRRAAACRGACTALPASGRARDAGAAPRRGAPERAAGERAELRAAEDELAGGVEALQAARERAERGRRGRRAARSRAWRPSTSTTPTCFFGRERLVAEMVARLAGAPLMGDRRAVGQRQVVGAARRAARRARRRACCRAASAGRSRCCGPVSIRCARSSRRRPARRAGGSVLAVDQFEELFTACRDEPERAAFVDALVARAARPAPAHARAGRRARRLLRALRRLPGAVAAARRQPRARRADAPRRAAPRDRAARRAAPACASSPSSSTRWSPTSRASPARCRCCRPSLLELWQRRDGRALRLSAYEQAGGVHGAVARLAERAYERLDAERRAGRARGSCCGWPARARATPSCAAGCRSTELERRGVGRVARRARRRAPASRSARARSRSPTRRCCASGRGCAAGSRRTPRAAGCTRHLIAAARELGGGRPRPAASSTAARGWPRRSTGPAPTRPSSTRPSARSSTRAAPRGARGRAPARAPAPAGAAGQPSPRCSRWRWSRASSRLDQRGERARRGPRGRRPARSAPRRCSGRPARSRAAARTPGRGARRLAADAQQPARGAAQEPRPRSACCAATATASSASTSARTGARSRSWTTTAR